MDRAARPTVALALLACVALAPVASAQDADVDRMEQVIRRMEDVKTRSTRQVAGAYSRAWEPVERKEPAPAPPPPSWPVRHKWKLLGAAALALVAFFAYRMESAWRRR